MNAAYLSAVANHLWQSTLFAGFAGLLTIALRNNRARVRHRVCLAASCKFLIPVSLLVALGGQVHWRTVQESVPSNFSMVMEAGQRFAAPAISGRLPATSSPSAIPAVLLAIWACGFAGISCMWWVRWRRIQAAARTGSPMQVAIPIPAVSSPALAAPGVFGVFRPVMLLPEGICESLTLEQLQALIAHEMCHVRYRDNLSGTFHMAVETVFWFHPVVWWIGKRMVEERERACDEEVLRLGSEPRVYADAILSVCKLCVESPLGCVAGVAGSNLKKRIVAIMKNKDGVRLSGVKKMVLAVCGTVAVLLPIAIGIVNAPAIQAQAAPAPPNFLTASIKPCEAKLNQLRGGGDSSPGKLSTGCDLLADEANLGLIQRAYVRFAGGHPHPFGVLPIKGGPAWIHSQMYEINAKAEGLPSAEMMQGPMLQALLENRFKLRIRRETREGPVYALMPAQGGSKLRLFTEGSCSQMPLMFPPPQPPPGQRYCSTMISLQGPAVDAEGNTLGEFSKLLDVILDRPVIDQTGIAGRFDIHLRFSADEVTPRLYQPGAAASTGNSDLTSPPISAAIQQQLGLKLEPAKGPVESLVIDHVERPSEN